MGLGYPNPEAMCFRTLHYEIEFPMANLPQSEQGESMDSRERGIRRIRTRGEGQGTSITREFRPAGFPSVAVRPSEAPVAAAQHS